MLKISRKKIFQISIIGSFLSLTSITSFAESILQLSGKKIIDRPTVYRDVSIDMTNGSFVVINNASLSLIHTKVKGKFSTTNSVLFNILDGHLILNENKFDLDAESIPPNPKATSLYPTISVTKGDVRFTRNNFSVNEPYRASLLLTGYAPTTDFVIRSNKINNFHGGLFLINSNNALVSNNVFSKVSLSNIFTKNSHNNVYSNNKMLYSGNNGIDIIDSHDIEFKNNYITLSSCYSIFILRSENLLLDRNKIIGGITYAIDIAPTIGLKDPYAQHLLPFVSATGTNPNIFKNKNIRITNNYISQNRFGIATTNLDGLLVENNIFIQKFSTDKNRQFWTNNSILLQDTLHIDWKNNLYKEAFNQNADSDPIAFKFVEYPETGGVVYTR